MVLLRVCAPEVKKKFQDCKTKKRCEREKLFASELRDRCGMFNPAKIARDVVAPASRRRFLRRLEIEKSPAGRRRYEKLPTYLKQLGDVSPLRIWQERRNKDYGVSLR
jgi:hypothetical protein